MVGRDGVAKRIDVIAAALIARFDLNDLLALDLAHAPPYSPAYDPILIAAQDAASHGGDGVRMLKSAAALSLPAT